MKRQGLIVINQPVNVKFTKLTYWDYIEKKQNSNEPALANPDLLPMPEEPEKSEELLAITEVLDQGGEKILTKRQRRAFQLEIGRAS